MIYFTFKAFCIAVDYHLVIFSEKNHLDRWKLETHLKKKDKQGPRQQKKLCTFSSPKIDFITSPSLELLFMRGVLTPARVRQLRPNRAA
jgi:hypothetical protein